MDRTDRAQMRSRLRRAAWAGALAVIVCAKPASATTIAVLMTPPAALTRLLHDSLKEHAVSRGITVHFDYAPEGAGAQQIVQARRVIAEKVDALVVSPVDSSAWAAIIHLAQEADVPLVAVNGAPRSAWFAGRVAFVQPDDLVAGRLQMRKLGQMLDGRGRVGILAGCTSHPGSTPRAEGVKEVLAESPGLRLVAEAAVDCDRSAARAAVADWLARKPTIDAIAAVTDEMAIGAAEAAEAAGIPAGRILIGGVDATAAGMQAMQDKRLAVTIHQDASLQGRRAIDDALALIRHEPVPQFDWVPSELVTDRMSTTHFSR